MELKTKVNVGDTIYFINDDKQISSDIVNQITIDIRINDIDITYYISKGHIKYSCLNENEIYISLEDLLFVLRDKFLHNK